MTKYLALTSLAITQNLITVNSYPSCPLRRFMTTSTPPIFHNPPQLRPVKTKVCTCKWFKLRIRPNTQPTTVSYYVRLLLLYGPSDCETYQTNLFFSSRTYLLFLYDNLFVITFHPRFSLPLTLRIANSLPLHAITTSIVFRV